MKRDEKERKEEPNLSSVTGEPWQWFHNLCNHSLHEAALPSVLTPVSVERIKHLLFVGKEETREPFQIIFSYLLTPICWSSLDRLLALIRFLLGWRTLSRLSYIIYIEVKISF